MSAKPASFADASERLELSVNAVASIAKGCPPETALALLRALQHDERRNGSIIDRELERLAAVSDNMISWPRGRGLSGIARVPTAVFPHVWLSAHEAALALSRLALKHLFWPIEGIDDADEQLTRLSELVDAKWQRAFTMPIEEVAEWQARIRRERAKFLASGSELKNVSSPETPPPRLQVDLACMTVTLDGHKHELDSKQALRWIKVLAEHPGQWISKSELQGYDRELDGTRTDRLKKFLPADVSSLIESKTGKGTRIRL